MTPEAWQGTRVLVTGHTGFKGAWLSLWLDVLGARVAGFSLPAADPLGAFPAMSPWSMHQEFLGDIADAQLVDDAVRRVRPRVIFHLAAQAIVGQGYEQPKETFATNVMGTVHVLEAARKLGDVVVVVVTSDKVYRNEPPWRPQSEGDMLGGTDPYSGSKAAAELAVDAYRQLLADRSCRVATARAGNVFGGGDRGDGRLLPDLFRAVERGESALLRSPEATRPWQFVMDPLLGYVLLAEHLLSARESVPPAVNFGPDSSRGAVTVGELVKLVQRRLPQLEVRVEPSTMREQHALAVESALARSALGWEPRVTLEEGVEMTVEWHRAQREEEDMRSFSSAQLHAYMERA